jgi:hypothetical protein
MILVQPEMVLALPIICSAIGLPPRGKGVTCISAHSSGAVANYVVYRQHLRRTTDEPFAMFLPGQKRSLLQGLYFP